jgi:diguanylate cyclase (GGDEF)-like protein
MAYARPERALDEAALDDAAGDAEAVSSGRAPASRGRRIAVAELREIENLRSINAQLRHELAAIKSREAETKKLADRDDLTGLYNRRRMLELLEAAICDAVQQDLHVGLLFIDLNGFKAVNDKYGHAAGDKILTTVATRILARVRAGDICCRYGGDEFVVVLPGVPDPFPVSRVADAIRERISLPYWIGNDQQRVTASIGESMYPHHGENAQKLLHRADEAMYRLKARIVRPTANAPAASQLRLTRRRNDKSKPRSGGTP